MRKIPFYLCAAIAAATVIAGCSKNSPQTEDNGPTAAMTLEDWCGTYEVQCTKTINLTHSDTGNIIELVDEPQTFEITISMTGTSETDSTVEFTGWSALDFTEEFTIYPGPTSKYWQTAGLRKRTYSDSVNHGSHTHSWRECRDTGTETSK